MQSDEAAYQRYFNGDETAANQLVETYGDALTFYLNGYLKDLHESEDLMIEAFAQLFVKARPISGEGSFKAYLYKTARNLALRHRQKRRIPFLHFDALPFEPSCSDPAEQSLLHHDQNHRLYDALRQLKPEYREALYFVYFEHMSYRNTAIILKKSESQITNLVHRGKQRLKTILEQEGFPYADQ